MSKKLKVKDNPTLVRDSHSKAVVNTDVAQYELHRSRKKRILSEREKMRTLEERISTLETALAKLI